MELRTLAERVLFSQTLADKLHAVDTLTDTQPGEAVAVPGFPARSPAWAAPRRPSARPAMPRLAALGEPDAVGHVMHVFANHELLALELMALALLRWPDAPRAFRLGLASMLTDEQRHMQLYLDRMAALGVEAGEIPRSRYFWDALAHVPDPLHFVAGLGLVFEQANLDHAAAYRAAFERVGDDVSARIMDTVLADELRHVRHGLRWFRSWRPPELSDWEAWTQMLAAWPGSPMSPVRARGRVFVPALRAQVGFDEEWTQSLAVAGASRGRPPTVWLFHPAAEDGQATGDPGHRSPARVQQMAHDLSVVPLFLARKDDVVVLPFTPSPSWLAGLSRCGFDLPETASCTPWPHAAAQAVAAPKVGGLEPWGWSPAAAQWLGPLEARLTGTAPTDLTHARDAAALELGHKDWSAAWLASILPSLRAEVDPDDTWLCAPDVLGTVCRSVAQVEDAMATHRSNGHGPLVVKARLGASGRGARRLLDPGLGREERAWLDRILAQQGAVVVEPWLSRRLDLSLHWDQLGEALKARGTATPINTAQGQFTGAWLGRLGAGWPEPVRGMLLRHDRFLRLQQALSRHLSDALCRTAPQRRGPIGIDALVYTDAAGTLRLKPVVELNPRWTMGRVALALQARLSPRRRARWHVLPRRKAPARLLEASTATLDAHGRMDRGMLWTTDPTHSEHVVGVLELLDP